MRAARYSTGYFKLKYIVYFRNSLLRYNKDSPLANKTYSVKFDLIPNSGFNVLHVAKFKLKQIAAVNK